MRIIALLLGWALGIPVDAPECRDPPPRASGSYWDYIEACGCARLDPPSKASLDYDRFLNACSQWHERNPQVNVIAPNAPPADSTALRAQASPQDAPECRNPPSRASDSYWHYIEACGCARLDPPSKASLDYDRFLKACSHWRQRNPQVNVVVPNTRPTGETGLVPTPGSGAEPQPTPSPSPRATPKPGAGGPR